MKKLTSFLITLLSLTVIYGIALAGNGNRLSSDPKYLVDLIAFDNCPTDDFTDSNRHMAAVKIDFADFRVIDGNVCNKGMGVCNFTNSKLLTAAR